MNKKRTLPELLFWLMFTVLIAVIALILDGFILKTFWAWFLLPVFPGAPKLTITTAIGLACLISFIGQSWTKKQEEGDLSDKLAAMVGVSIITPLITLGLGWLVWLAIY